ncbi:MAG: DUF721 domain-containing protein [Bacteroidia bacterium]
MRNDDYIDLGKAITQFLEKHGMRDAADIQKIIDNWEKIMGKPIAQQTERLWLRDRVFYVAVKSPVWKNELTMIRTAIKEMIHDKIGRVFLDEVRIV